MTNNKTKAWIRAGLRLTSLYLIIMGLIYIILAYISNTWNIFEFHIFTKIMFVILFIAIAAILLIVTYSLFHSKEFNDKFNKVQNSINANR